MVEKDLGCSINDPVAMVAAVDEFSDGSACCFLKGDAFQFSAFAECRLFIVGES